MLAKLSCDQCNQYDDHPKLHYGVNTYHHDCAPYLVRRAVEESSPLATQIFTACVDGRRGAELRNFITQLHDGGTE